MNQLVAISTVSEFNNCQYNTIKYISKLLNFSSDYVDNILKQLGFYDKWFKSNKKNNNNAKYSQKDPYEILGLSKGASREEIKKKYKELVKKFHPDFIQAKGLDEEFLKFAEERMKEINRAYEILMKNS